MSLLGQVDPIPVEDSPIDGDSRPLSASWFRWLSQVLSRALLTWLRAASPVHRTGLSASIVATALFTPAQTGDFRISWTTHITQAATVNSSVTVTIGWTAPNGSACTKTFTAMTGNTIATADGDAVFIRASSSAPVTYAVAYASVGATPAIYEIDVASESAPAS